MSNEKTLWKIVKEEAQGLSEREWLAVIAGVVGFIILTGLCG